MNHRSLLGSLLTGCTVSLSMQALSPLCLAGRPDQDTALHQTKRLQAMQAAGAEASLTIFPVVLWDTEATKDLGDIGRDIADVIGLLLEQSGMVNLEATDNAFLLPAEADFGQASQPFGEFVRDNPISTDYALYTEYLGRTGPPRIDEIRAVIVDRAGELVWLERLTPDDPAFKRMNPDCPMECCVLLTQRVGGLLKLQARAGDDAGEGKFARRLAAKSTVPDKTELAAMEPRLAAMRAAGSSVSVAIFPILMPGDDSSDAAAAQLAGVLSGQQICEPRALRTPLSIELQRTHDQLKGLWDMARAFRDHLRQNPSDADYSLCAQYALSPRGGDVRGVNFVVCDRNGEWVIVDLQNDHHGDFQQVDPKTADDCGQLVARRLQEFLR